MKNFIVLTDYADNSKFAINKDYIVKVEKENDKVVVEYNLGHSGYFCRVKESIDEILELLNS